MNDLRSSPTPSRRAWIALGALLILATAVFTWRSLLRSPRLYDFRTVYAASRALVFGDDPYNHATLDRIWADAGGADLIRGGPMENFPSVYPPTTFVVMAPFSLLPAWWACVIWSALTLILLAGAIVALGRLAQLSPTRHLLLAAIVLLLGSVHSGVQGGNLVVAAVSLIVIGLRLIQMDRKWLGLILLTIATCLKPQLGAAFLAWQFLRLPKQVIVIGLVLAAITGGAIWRMQATAPAWRGSFRANYQVAVDPGGSFDFTSANIYRDHLINAHVPLFATTTNTRVTKIVIATIAVTLLGVALVRRRAIRSIEPVEFLLAASMVSVLTLMPVYHRYYDAMLLVLPIAWGIRDFRRGVVLLALTIPLLLPVGWASNLALKGHVSSATTDGALWNVLVMPFFGWLMLAWCAVLTSYWLRNREPKASS